jgi:hypothetical protein
MKKIIFILTAITFTLNGYAQECIKGNCKNGKGTMKIGGDVFTGHFKDGKRYGYGEILRDNGTIIKGFFINNYINGPSTTITKNGDVLLRNYINEVMFGKSVFTSKSGNITEEYYNDDTLNGLSILNTSEKIYSKSFYIVGESLGQIYYRSENVPDFYYPKKSNEVVTDETIGKKLIYSLDGTFTTIPGGEDLDGYGIYFDGKKDRGYLGQYKKGYKHGKGIRVSSEGNKFIGEYKKAEWVYGSYKYSTGSEYIGEFKDGEFHGNGIYKSADRYIYEGEFKKGNFHGKGKKVNFDESIYEGEFEKDQYNGTGKLTSPNKKSYYLGEWKDNKRNGKGSIVYFTGYTEVGTWLNGLPQNTKYYDAAKKEITREVFYEVVDAYEPYIIFWQTNITKYNYVYKNFSMYVGNANEGIAEGNGTYIGLKSMYVGNWLNDKRNGTGTEYLDNGYYAIGTWTNDIKSVVTYYDFKGNEITKEEYEK